MALEEKAGLYFRIEAEIQIEASPEAVFEALTSGLDAWWPHRTDEKAKIVFDHKPGGMIYEDHGDGKHIAYGVVAGYNPPHTLVSLDLAGWGDGAYNSRNIENVEADGKGGSIYKKTLILWGAVPEEVAEMFSGGVTSLMNSLKEYVEGK
jgi:uncharacterized protein YndB with AHSA1/START domain